MKYLTVIFVVTSLISCQVSRLSKSDAHSTSKEQLLFTSKRDGNFEVYRMNDDGTNVSNLSNHSATDYGLNWSPDGKYILFYSDRTGNEEVWRMHNDGTNLVNLTHAPSSERAASYSPNGQTIVFTSDRDNKTKDLYLMDSNGANVRRLTNNKVYCESPEWTNDGKQIVYTMLVQRDSTDQNFNGEIFIINADGSNQRRLTNRDGFDSGADISPDGKKISFYGKSELGNYDIFIMNLDGSDIMNLTNDQIEDYSPSWSSDGNWVSFTSGNSTNYDIWKMNVYTKEKIRLTTQPKRDETPYYRPQRK